MKRIQLKAAAFSLLTVFVLVIAACAPAATPTPTATPTPPPVAATPTPGVATPTPAPGVATPTPTLTTATPTPVAGMPAGYGFSEFGEWGMPLNMPPAQYGGILRQSGTIPPHYDSHRTYSAIVANPTYHVLDGLVRFSPYMDIGIIPGGYDVKYVGPSLAERWEVSKDGMMMTFYLKKGVKWHDGKPFTAKDVKYSLDKMRDPKRSVFTPDLAMVDRVEMVDDYTVTFYLKYPASRLLFNTLAIAQLTIQAEHLKDVSYRTKEFVVGTGPFKLKSITPGLEMVWEKSSDYHFKGRPYLDGVMWRQLANSTKYIESFSVGQYDLISMLNAGEVESELLRRLAPGATIRLTDRIGAINNVWLSFVKEGPWQDVRVRKAMAMVLDYKELCVAVYGTAADYACVDKAGYFLSAPVGPGLPFEEYEKAWLLNRPIGERATAAKKLLAEAGYPAGFKIEWLATASLRENLLVIMDTWKKLLTIQSDIRIVAAAQELDLIQKGDFGAYSRSSISWSGAMEAYVSNSFVTGGSTNYSFYFHPEVERLYIELLKEQDVDKAVQIFHRIERLLIEDVPYIPLAAISQTRAAWPYLKPQMFTHPYTVTEGNTIMTVVWLDQNDPSWAKRAK